ncbi:ammonium transporter 3 member 2-like [Populus alba x Populus x berolinensis]|nr:ammonium transporter 3 member 2-like [Populus alba x Populus x berolinensis]KAJ6930822.1 ammonium transporter 3 member 2-like [Populus alba x Populus x berolinensis]
MLGGAGFLWLGWTGFNGGSPFAAGLVASVAIFNTHLCTATSLLVWVSLDMVFYRKSPVIGAVQGMITGLVCITPGAEIVEPWAALLMGVMSGSIPWYTLMVLHRRFAFFQSIGFSSVITSADNASDMSIRTGYVMRISKVAMHYHGVRQHCLLVHCCGTCPLFVGLLLLASCKFSSWKRK